MIDTSVRHHDAARLSLMTRFLWPGATAAQAIYVAVKLEIPELLWPNPKTLEELAAATRANAPSLRRLLRALVSVNVFTEGHDHRFAHTPLSEALRRDHPQSLRALALAQGAPWLWRPVGELYESVMSGAPSFERVAGMSLYEYLAQHPPDAAAFEAALDANMAALANAIVDAYDFARFGRVVDVGGGYGVLLHRILCRAPAVRGLLFDRPDVVARAETMRAGTIGARCELRGGDFFEEVPQGGDAYILNRVLHNWDDDASIRLLGNCRRAMSPHATLLLIEPTADGAPDLFSAFLDLHMLVLTTGHERTTSEYAALLTRAGFSLERVLSAKGLGILECRPCP